MNALPYFTAFQRQNLRAVRLCKAQPARMTRDGLKPPEASEGQRTARRTPPGTPRGVSCKKVRVDSGPPRLWGIQFWAPSARDLDAAES